MYGPFDRMSGNKAAPGPPRIPRGAGAAPYEQCRKLPHRESVGGTPTAGTEEEPEVMGERTVHERMTTTQAGGAR